MRVVATVFGLVLAGGLTALAADKPPSMPMPPVQVRQAGGEWGPKSFPWQGVAIVADPINKETLYLGGHHGGAESGSLGNWALAEDGKTWRALKTASLVLEPLQDKCLAARSLVRHAEAAARNLYYAALPRDKEAQEVKGDPAKFVADAMRLAADLPDALGKGKQAIHGYDLTPTVAAWAEGMGRAKPLVEKALASLKAAQDGFLAGRLDAELIKLCFDAQWALDEAADSLRSSPGPRYGAFAGYDPVNKCVVLFGGSHSDYVMSDTWLYDCASKEWRRVWPRQAGVAPSPRMCILLKGTIPSTQPEPTLRWLADNRQLALSGGMTVLTKMVYQQGYTPLPENRWTFHVGKCEWSADAETLASGVAPGTRTYRTVCPAYDPCWYDAAPGTPREAAAAVAEWLARLPANIWTEVPRQERPAPERDWGTAAYDPDRDQIYRWTGGHCADPGNNMSTYHPGLNRWSIPHVPEIYGKGISFNGRPDCMNHTYLHYAYDPLSRRLVCTSMGGTGVYNPDRRDWDYTIAQPFNHHIYETCTVSTPAGVVVWTPGFFGVMDVKAREWKKLPATGKLPRSVTDGSAISYDSRRECIWMASFLGYQKASGQMWRYDTKSGEVKAMDPAGKDTIGLAKGFNGEIRESVYLPKLDLVLFNNFVGGMQAAYDPAKNRWVLLGIDGQSAKAGSNLGGVSAGLVHDTKRDLVWAMGNYKHIYVLRIDEKRLAITDSPTP